MFNVKNLLNWPIACTILGAASMLASCDSAIYEDLPVCEETARHAVKFQWTRNMLGADAFSGNVHSVAVYVFDENDKYVTTFTESGDVLAMQGYTLPIVGLEPGNYTFVAWCGLDNSAERATRSESFTIDDCIAGKTSRQDLLCTMKRDIYSDGTHHSSEELFDLYHGTAYGVTIYDDNDLGDDHIYTINLTKDTNNVAIILQNLSGEDIDISKFFFQIEENNGTMKPDNSLDETDEVINYHEYDTFTGTAGVDIDTKGTRAIENVTTGMALIKTSRLMANKHSMLTIRNSETNELVARLPMIDYALIGKVGDPKGKFMTPQEYLDSQDDYKLTFFLDKNGNWMSAYININAWTIYLQDTDINTEY